MSRPQTPPAPVFYFYTRTLAPLINNSNITDRYLNAGTARTISTLPGDETEVPSRVNALGGAGSAGRCTAEMYLPGQAAQEARARHQCEDEPPLLGAYLDSVAVNPLARQATM